MAVSPTRPKGPPLTALRAFEVASRLESFVAAAEELSVTPGAVSQQIKTLEVWAGTALFTRHAQGVRLTAAGRTLRPLFETAFDRLGDAVRALRDQTPATEVHIATMPSLAQLWLSPRLVRVRAQLPGIALSVTALETPPNLNRELFDLSLFLRQPTGAATEVVLEQDRIFPVCAPALADRADSWAELDALPRLIDRSWAGDWADWAESGGLTLSDRAAGATFSLFSLALEEAKAGAGVLMGHACLVEAALAAGDLVQVGPHDHRTGKALVLDRPARAGAGGVVPTVVDMLRQTV